MAAAVICECCGDVKSVKVMVHVRVYEMTSPEQYRTKAEDYFDICKDCYTHVEDLLKYKEKRK